MFDVDDARITRSPAHRMAGPGGRPLHGDLLPLLLRRPDSARDIRRRLGRQVHDRAWPEQDGLLLGPRGHQLAVSDRRPAADGQQLDRLQGEYTSSEFLNLIIRI